MTDEEFEQRCEDSDELDGWLKTEARRARESEKGLREALVAVVRDERHWAASPLVAAALSSSMRAPEPEEKP